MTAGAPQRSDPAELNRRASLASHRLVGWIYWDPRGVAAYEALGVPGGTGWYVATRAAPLAPAGDAAVTAAFGSVHADFVSVSLALCREHTTFEAAAAARDDAVLAGLEELGAELCEPLASLDAALWEVADALPLSGRVLFGAHRDRARPPQPLLSAWLAVNCIREWRGDTHWALLAAEGIDGVQAGVLDGAWRGYDDDWLARSRGADDAAIAAAHVALGERGLSASGVVTDEGLRYREAQEVRLDELTALPWELLGQERTERLISAVDSHGEVLVGRVDATAGPNWMPAARERRRPTR